MKRIVISLLCLFVCTCLFAQKPVADSIGLVRILSHTPADIINGKVSGAGVSNLDGSPVSGRILNIRGLNSVNSDNQPLYIIDGVRINTDVNRHVDAFWQFDDGAWFSANNPLGIVALQDIRSIEVLKDAAATALYGSDAANGVVIINTRPLVNSACVVDWISDFGVEVPSVLTYGTSVGLTHRHYVRFNGKVGNSRYNMSANFRSKSGAVSREKINFGGINASIDSKAGNWLDFGFKLIVGAGNQNRTSGAAYMNGTSLMTDIRNNASKEVIDGWISSFDDGATEYRGLINAYANFNIAKMLRWENSLSADWMTSKRTVWYGKATAFGLKHNVAASMLTNSLLSYSARSVLKFDTYLFGSNHHLNVNLGAEYQGRFDQFNTLNGKNMLTEELRGKALNLMNYHFFPHAFDVKHGTFGPMATLSYSALGYAGLIAGARTEFSNRYMDWTPTVLPTASLYVDLRKAIMPRSVIVSRLKLVGNLGATMFEQAGPYDFQNPFYESVVRLYTQEWTAGVEAGFLKGTVNLAVKYYDRRTTDRNMVYCFGHTVQVNGVDMWNDAERSQYSSSTSVVGNRGVELDFDAILYRTKSVSVKLYGTGSYNANCLLESDSPLLAGMPLNGAEYYTASAVGLSLSSFYGYKKDVEGNPVDMTGEGEITYADKIVLGTSIPKFRYSLGVEARWKAFRAEALFAGAAGHSVYDLHENKVEDASYLRMERLGIGYTVPLKKKKVLKGINVIVGANNLFTITGYSGYNPDVNCFGLSALSYGLDSGSYPLMRSVTAGVTLRF